jgi:hypothetical protein
VADTTTSTGSEQQDKPRRAKAAAPVEQAAIPEKTAAVETLQDASAPADEPTAGGWLRYDGQTPQVFMDLGGEINPGDLVRPRDESLRVGLLARGDFEPAQPPAPDSARTAR